MKLIFVDNLLFSGSISRPEFDLQPNLGLMSLAAVCRQQGYAAEIYDPKRELASGRLTLNAALYEQLARDICDRGPTVVGMTTLGCNFHCVVRVARAIRSMSPETPILLGGPHATILHREILERFPEFHAVVRGEAEESLVEILPRLPDDSLAGIKGVSFRSDDGEVQCGPPNQIVSDLDTLPIPAYDVYPIEQLGLTTLRVEAGRGCPFSCTFCSTASFFGRNYRLKSPERLRSEMLMLRERYRINDFKLNHDLFTVNREKVLAFCASIRNDGFTWGCSARVDCVDESLLIAMNEAGCRSIYFGIEAGSDRIQRTSRKRLDLSLVKPTLEITEKLGIKTTTSFITGYPDEQRSDHRSTLDMVGELHVRSAGLNTSQLHLLTPEPGTQLILELGDALRLDHYISGFNFPRFDSTDDNVIASNPKIFPNHFHYPTILPRERHVGASFLWYEVSQLGRLLVAYLLRYFGSSFDCFADAFYVWQLERDHSGPVTSEQLIAFFETHLFEDHHILSLLRYSFAIRGLSYKAGRHKAHVTQITELANLPAQYRYLLDSDAYECRLVLQPKVRVLPRIHDCLQLLKLIARDESGHLLNDAMTGPRRDEVLVMGEDGIQSYVIDPQTRELLGLFSQPISYIHACLALAERPDAPLPAWEDITDLLDSGVLQFAESAASDRELSRI